jgi:hypothetical protein
MQSLKRVYIASKVGTMEGPVRELKQTLESLGFSITYDWTAHPIRKPFEECVREAAAAAEAMRDAVFKADIVIVLLADNGLGLHIETGIAIASAVMMAGATKGKQQNRIYVVGEDNNRSIFYFLDSVTRLPNVPSLIEELRIISEEPSETDSHNEQQPETD